MPTGVYVRKVPANWCGRVFGRLTVVKFQGVSQQRKRQWLCRCVCGKEVTCLTESLIGGNSQSCGCLRDDNRHKRKGMKLPQLSSGYGVAAKNAVICIYRHRARKFGRAWNLTAEDCNKIFCSDCHYCGKKPSHRSKNQNPNTNYGDYIYSGIDRVDSSKGYEIGNVVPSCGHCNKAKNDMPYKEFLDWIKRVYDHHFSQIRSSHAN